jgi:hypothetical protein
MVATSSGCVDIGGQGWVPCTKAFDIPLPVVRKLGFVHNLIRNSTSAS